MTELIKTRIDEKNFASNYINGINDEYYGVYNNPKSKYRPSEKMDADFYERIF
ncbi:hypothetical protein [Elizabethkingia meningoseptica]|uniref:hypothetical protein n=1 Tax=Elizabethkingia meningoseptica TaxID=238 RepID=UPI00039AFD1C|nr:hypothetical protein [Elizabethkingia meningoseptica]